MWGKAGQSSENSSEMTPIVAWLFAILKLLCSEHVVCMLILSAMFQPAVLLHKFAPSSEWFATSCRFPHQARRAKRGADVVTPEMQADASGEE